MKCPRCQAESPSGMRFCGQCAAPLAAVCRTCGSANPPGNKFCGQCAAPLTAATGPRLVSPDSYTPKHLAERILTSKAALEGERKQVTVLFADLKGSMELLADRDPEEARKILDPVLELMMEAVHRYEGTVNQVMGDGIMALFGAPIAHEDHAVRACYAALRMQEAIRRYTEEMRRSLGVEVQIRVGLNSGEVVVRSIGSDLRMDYSAVGQTTHLAARMEQLAPSGTIRLTAEVLRLAEGFVQVTPLGPIGQGRRRAGRSLRADWRLCDSRPLAGGTGARLHPLRRAGRRDGAGPPGGRAGPAWTGTDRRGGWRSRRGQVAAVLRVPPVAPPCGVARAGGGIRLLRQGDGVPASRGFAADLLPHRGPRRHAGRACQGHGDGAHARSRAGGHAAGRHLGARRAPLRGPVFRARARPAPAARARRREATAAAREPGPAAAAGVRGPALGRRRDPGGTRWPGGRPADRGRAPCRELPSRVSPRLGQQDVLPPAPDRSAGARERQRAPAGTPG